MTKRAKYIGPFEEVVVQDSEAGIYSTEAWIVKRGSWLPDDAPARIRDELLQDTDAWTEVKQGDEQKKKESGS